MSLSYLIRKNKVGVSIFIYLFIMGSLLTMKPAFLYHTTMGWKHFGVGYKQKTILPIWLLAIFVAILSYLSVLFYIRYL
jgi:hypothetical protein